MSHRPTRNRWALPGAAAFAASVALVAGCAENILSGSVGELFSLQVSKVSIHKNDEALQIAYLQNRGTEVDVVVRLSVALEGVQLAPGKRIPLEGEYAPGHLRTTVVHAPGGEPVRRLPPVKKGDLVLSEGGEAWQQTSGNFSMSFEAEGGDLGGGRTLAGQFSGVAVDAGFGLLPDGGVWPQADGGFKP